MADDIRYEKVDGRRRETVLLSDDVGPSAANRTAKVVASSQGNCWWRVLRQRVSGAFRAGGPDGSSGYSYIGNLEGLAWFNPPTRDQY